MNDLVSVIIPVYNSCERLDRCITSILKQTYRNIELVIVDDGSTDSGNEIIKKYTDSRIHYYYQDNRGPSVARNKGLELSKGEYILFIDSDDYIDCNMVEYMINAMVNDNADFAVCDFCKQITLGKNIVVREPYSGVHDWQSFLKAFVLKNGVCSLWNKIFKRSLINKIRFYEDIRLGEDSSFLLRIIPFSKRIAYVNKTLYTYDLTSEGISRNAKKNICEYLISCNRVLTFYNENNIVAPVPECYFRLKICYYTLYFLSLGKAKERSYWDYFIVADFYNKDFIKIIFNNNFNKIGLKYRLFTVIYNIDFFLFYKKKYNKMKTEIDLGPLS